MIRIDQWIKRMQVSIIKERRRFFSIKESKGFSNQNKIRISYFILKFGLTNNWLIDLESFYQSDILMYVFL